MHRAIQRISLYFFNFNLDSSNFDFQDIPYYYSDYSEQLISEQRQFVKPLFLLVQEYWSQFCNSFSAFLQFPSAPFPSVSS